MGLKLRELKLQIENLSRLLSRATSLRDKALEMVHQKDEAIKCRDIAIHARDKYIKELEDRLEYYEGNNAGPLSGRH